MKKLLVFLCAGLLVLGIYSTVGAIPSDNLVTNGTFDDDGVPWQLDGTAEIFGGFGNPFAAFYADSDHVGFALQELTIPEAVDTLYLSFDYGFLEAGDTDPSDDDLDEDGFPVNTAALLAFILNDIGIIQEIFVVATESTSDDPSFKTYDGTFNSHFCVSFDASELAGESAGLAIGVIPDGGIQCSGAVDNVTLSTTAPVPEPATLLLLSSGLIGLAAFRRRFTRRDTITG